MRSSACFFAIRWLALAVCLTSHFNVVKYCKIFLKHLIVNRSWQTCTDALSGWCFCCSVSPVGGLVCIYKVAIAERPGMA